MNEWMSRLSQKSSTSKIIDVHLSKKYVEWTRRWMTCWNSHDAHDNPALSHEAHVNLTIRKRTWCEPILIPESVNKIALHIWKAHTIYQFMQIHPFRIHFNIDSLSIAITFDHLFYLMHCIVRVMSVCSWHMH